jgi:hypothetical protein
LVIQPPASFNFLLLGRGSGPGLFGLGGRELSLIVGFALKQLASEAAMVAIDSAAGSLYIIAA